MILQHDHLAIVRTRIVAPLIGPEDIKRLDRLHPLVKFAGQDFVLAMEQMATVDIADLRAPEGDVEAYRDQITRALDFLFSGY